MSRKDKRKFFKMANIEIEKTKANDKSKFLTLLVYRKNRKDRGTVIRGLFQVYISTTNHI